MEKPRYIGVVADGSTDKEILLRLVQSLLLESGPFHEVRLRQSLADYMSSFRYVVDRTGQLGFFDKPSTDLRKGIINVIFSAVGELRGQARRDVREYDLLILNTDAEWSMRGQDHYFQEQKFILLSKIFYAAIEEYYHKAGNKHLWMGLPQILPLILFPSTDILVAAAKATGGQVFSSHGLRAREIKRQLYHTDDLRYLKGNDLATMALSHITAGGCVNIYSHLPEARVFLRNLTGNHTIQTR